MNVAQILFGGFRKIMMWIIIIAFVAIMIDSEYPQGAFTFMLAGALIISPAIPAILAAKGRTVLSCKSKKELRGLIESEFSSKKGKTWSACEGVGDLNFSLNLSAFPGPTVSIGFVDINGKGTEVLIEMTEWSTGGFTPPFFWAADPFWHHGASKALKKIKQVASRIEDRQAATAT